MNYKFILLFLSLSLITYSCKPNSSGIKKIAKTSVKKSIKGENVALKKAITEASSNIGKNGLGQSIRIDSKSTKKILLDTYELRGEKECEKVIAKILSFKGTNHGNIKGYLAEELHHNELLKMKGVFNVTPSIKGEVTQNMLNIQKQTSPKFYNSIIPDKIYEIDLLAEHDIRGKFAIEVKNIDSQFSYNRFVKIKQQLLKQISYCKENNIKTLFWSNIGNSKLEQYQIKQLEEMGVVVIQHNSESPIINTHINMTKIKMYLNPF